jgi:hypothetical protein
MDVLEPEPMPFRQPQKRVDAKQRRDIPLPFAAPLFPAISPTENELGVLSDHAPRVVEDPAAGSQRRPVR